MAKYYFLTSSINHFNELLYLEVHVYPHFKRVSQEEIDVAKGNLRFTVTASIDLIIIYAQLTIERHRTLFVAKSEQLKGRVGMPCYLCLIGTFYIVLVRSTNVLDVPKHSTLC